MEGSSTCVKSQYDGFVHLIRSLGISTNSLIPMFTLYCDDSGTHSRSEISVAACLIAPVDQWDRLKEEWNRANECEEFGVFHMADFVAKQEQFSSPKWADQTKRDRTIKRLLNIIQTRVQYAIACAVVKSAYDDVLSENIQHPFWIARKSHYTFTVRHCIAHIERWRTRFHHREPIQYVFDRLSKGKGEIDQEMELGATGGELALQALGECLQAGRVSGEAVPRSEAHSR